MLGTYCRCSTKLYGVISGLSETVCIAHLLISRILTFTKVMRGIKIRVAEKYIDMPIFNVR